MAIISPGHRVEIRPAYNSETGERDIWDEIAGLEGRVIRHGRGGTGEHVVRLLDDCHPSPLRFADGAVPL